MTGQVKKKYQFVFVYDSNFMVIRQITDKYKLI